MVERVKIGIIGVGQIGKRHIKAYRDLPVEIIAAADTNEDALAEVKQEYGVERTLSDFQELLAIEEIEAVDICLHNNLHAPVAIASLEAGKHVYCEKPIAGSYADGRAMVSAARKTGKMLAIQLFSLFTVQTKAAQRLIEAGRLGDLYYARSVGFRRRGRPYVDGYGTDSFVQKRIAAGGALFDMGVYHIAQILHLLGNPSVKTVSGSTHQEIPMYEERRENSHYDVEELGLGFVRLDGGITFFIEESWALHEGRPASTSAIFGSEGGVEFDPFSFHTTVVDMEMDATFDLKQADWRWHQCDSDADAYDNSQAHWVAALQNRVPLINSAELALATMKISEGIYRSARLGREVSGEEIETESKSTAIAL